MLAVQQLRYGAPASQTAILKLKPCRELENAVIECGRQFSGEEELCVEFVETAVAVATLDDNAGVPADILRARQAVIEACRRGLATARLPEAEVAFSAAR